MPLSPSEKLAVRARAACARLLVLIRRIPCLRRAPRRRKRINVLHWS